MKNVTLFFFTFLFLLIAGCPESQPNTIISSRTVDLHDGNIENSEVIVISMDTDPTPGSRIFKQSLDFLGYEYYLLGATTDAPLPKRHGLFRLALWEYRFKRYQKLVSEIAKKNPKQIIILSDASDVVFALSPEEAAKAFKAIGKNIVFTGHLFCCNVNMLKYIEVEAKKLQISDIFSTDPEVVAIVKLLPTWSSLHPREFGYAEAPAKLWTPEAMHEMSRMKTIPLEPKGPATKYRYINGGGIAGYAESLKKAMDQINMQPFDDDEEQWSLWYANVGYPTGEAIIDYKRQLFAIVDEMEGMDSEISVLFDDQPILPTSKFFDFEFDPLVRKWRSKAGYYPSTFHCAGCPQSKMQVFRRKIINSMAGFLESLDQQERTFIEKG